MQGTIAITGEDVHMASPREIEAGIRAAGQVFARNQVAPLDCAAAQRKREQDELLSREEALRCAIWDEADDAAWRAATVGWLSRDVDIRLAVS